MISIRITTDEIKALTKEVDAGRFRSLSEAIRETSRVGRRVIELQQIMHDKDKAKEFKNKIEEALHAGDVMKWAATVETDQIEAMVQVLNLERDSRQRQVHIF